MHGNMLHTLVAILLVWASLSLFTAVAANAIAIVGTNPVSGMTLMTLILASVVMVAFGLKGRFGNGGGSGNGRRGVYSPFHGGRFHYRSEDRILAGKHSCQAGGMEVSGHYRIGVGGVMIILNKTYGFTSGALAAPQAMLTAAVIEPFDERIGLLGCYMASERYWQSY